jgi:methylphosphotriester-DNA--protein-cysteine methyltransferase
MYNTKYCKVEYLKNKNAIFFQWKEFCKEDDYRNPFRHGAELIEKYQPKTWITDTTNGFENEEADTKWLLEEFVPLMIESSIEKIIFVIKNDSPLMGEIVGQKEALDEFFEVELLEGVR